MWGGAGGDHVSRSIWYVIASGAALGAPGPSRAGAAGLMGCVGLAAPAPMGWRRITALSAAPHQAEQTEAEADRKASSSELGVVRQAQPASVSSPSLDHWGSERGARGSAGARSAGPAFPPVPPERRSRRLRRPLSRAGAGAARLAADAAPSRCPAVPLSPVRATGPGQPAVPPAPVPAMPPCCNATVQLPVPLQCGGRYPAMAFRPCTPRVSCARSTGGELDLDRLPRPG